MERQVFACFNPRGFRIFYIGYSLCGLTRVYLAARILQLGLADVFARKEIGFSCAFLNCFTVETFSCHLNHNIYMFI